MDSGLHNIMFNTLEFDNLKQETISPLLKQFINPLAYNPYTIEQWQSVIQLIDIRLQPIEECAINRFRTKLLSLSNKVDCKFILFCLHNYH